MVNQFSRLEMQIGLEAFEKLKNSKVIVFGLGGVGSYVVEAMARCGIGKIDIVDSDKVTLTNLNRQIYALHSTIGEYKTQVAHSRMVDINPDIKVKEYQLFFSSENASVFEFEKYDYIIDAIDTVKSKIELIELAKKYNVQIISSMGTGNKLNPLKFEIADISKTSVCPLAKVMRRELKKRNIKNVKVLYSKELPIKPKFETNEISSKRCMPASNSFTPSIAGLIIASEVVKDLIKDYI